ncbi:hypothetical protein ACWDSJ_28045 [Nocardia sp. NPDC003482]
MAATPECPQWCVQHLAPDPDDPEDKPLHISDTVLVPIRDAGTARVSISRLDRSVDGLDAEFQVDLQIGDRLVPMSFGEADQVIRAMRELMALTERGR